VQTELLRPRQLDDERFNRAAEEPIVRRSQVDQVRIVRERRAEAGPPPRLPELSHVPAAPFPCPPLVCGLRDKPHRLCPERCAGQQSVVVSTGNRQMCAKPRHGRPPAPSVRWAWFSLLILFTRKGAL